MGLTAAGYLALTAIGTSVASGVQQYQASEKAEDIAAENAAMVALETEEAVKRMEYEQAQIQAVARAKKAASGAGGETFNVFMGELEDVGAQEIDWLKKVGASRYRATEEEGRYASMMGRAGAVRAFGGAFQQGAQFNWGSAFAAS